MTRLKKRAAAAVAAILLVAGVLTGLLAFAHPKDAVSAFAYDSIDCGSDTAYLEIQDGTVLGFKQGVTLPDNISLTIPDANVTIAERAFETCKQLVRVAIGSNVSGDQIGANAFRECTRLVEIATESAELNASALKNAGAAEFGRINNYALNIHDGNSTAILGAGDCLYITDNVKEQGEKLYVVGAGDLGGDGSLQLPKLDKEYAVYNYAFHQQAGIRSVTVEGGAEISEIGRLAFYECPDLETVDLSGGSVKSIAYSAFTRCTRLSSLTLSQDLETVEGFAFGGCTALGGTLTVPNAVTGIGESAFAGCTALESLVFTADGTSLTLSASAFNGCSSLTVVELPAHLKNMEVQAFTDCAILNTVYLNSQVNFVANVTPGEPNVYFGNNTLVIFDTQAHYGAAVQSGSNAAAHARSMTFLVTLKFTEVGDVAAGAQPVERERLYMRDYNFTKNADKSWGKAAASDIPVQEGYSASVWYKESALSSAVTDYTGLLADTESETVELFAKRIEKPELTAKELTYNKGTTYSVSNTSAFLNGTADASLLDLKIYQGSEWKQSGVSDAGNYTFVAAIKEPNKYGSWASNYELAFTISKQAVAIANRISWQLDGHNLMSGLVYEYTNASGATVYYPTVQSDSDLTYVSVYNLTNSIARHKQNDTALTVTLPDSTDGYYTVVASSYQNNVGTTVGRYVTAVTVQAGDNYLLRNFGDSETATSAERGVTIEISTNRDTAIITKVWYVIDIGNYLVDGADAQYSIANWTFGNGAAVTAPKPVYDNADHASADGTRFTFTKDGEDVTQGHSYALSEFGNVVNATMPAGEYVLTFMIGAVTAEDGTHYEEAIDTVTFTVAPAAFNWGNEVKSAFADKSVRWNNDALQLYRASDLTGAFQAKVPAITPTGIWTADFYDADFTLTYNFAGEQNNTYRPYDGIEGVVNTAYLPKTPGTYTVYYNFTAKNYEPMADISSANRTDYAFTITVFRVLRLPTVAALTYTGSRMLPLVTEGETGTSSLYEIVYDTTEGSYINAGTHTVTVTLTDGAHYKWADGADYLTAASKQLSFTINRADNDYSLALSIPQWTYGNFDIKLHRPVWSTVFNTAEPDFYTFTLTDEDGKVYTYDETRGFNAVPIGTYTFTATAKGYVPGDATTEKYNWNRYVQTGSVIIAKGVNTWAVTPNVMQWAFGSYEKEVNLILAEASIVDENNPVKFKVTYDAAGKNIVTGLEEFTAGSDGVVSDEVAHVLAGLRVSSYYLWSSVDSTTEYLGINPLTGFEFKVTRSENYWDEAPAIATWIVGSYDDKENTITAKPHFGGTVNYKIVLAGDEDKIVFDSANGVNELAQAGVGVYELRASVAGTDDYADLVYTLTFRIFEKAGLAWWAILLIVIGSLAVVALVVFILHQRGILQVLTGKVVLAMRTRATVDATIAAVRANKVAEESRQALADAEAKEAAEARRRAIEEAKSRPLDERADVLEELAREEAERAGKIQKRADTMYLTAEKMRQRANRTREHLETQVDESLEETEETEAFSEDNNDTSDES